MLIYILFILGFIFLIKGADLLVEGSSSLAKRLGISDIVIGLTIVSLGTSAPELLVNIVASLKGNADIGIGNILGSNISNIFLILGISALIYPLKIKHNTTWKEIPLNMIAVIVLFLLVNDIWIDKAANSILSRSDGIILMIFFIIFMYYTFGLAKAHKEKHDGRHKHPPLKAIGMTLLGIVGLAYGGQWVVDGAITVAKQFGLSEALIGLTIVAVGTSLPELATSATAAYKHKTDIAIGNVVGSNLFNIFWVLGLSAVIKPMPFNPMINTDILVCLIATIMLFAFCFTKSRYQIDRAEGGILVMMYAGYIVFLIMRG
ncbi:calcium/sodium antiporter [Patescibacteria group bacterium]|nr:calcium/sodium antiporter [Patescibacteria group bacterium]